MTNVAILISWCIICITYFSFRSDVQGNADPVVEARSPFQPVLAGYGVFATAVVGNNTKLDELTNIIVILQGFQSWTRNAPYWSQTDGSWGFSLAPWVVIGIFFFAVVDHISFCGRRSSLPTDRLDPGTKVGWCSTSTRPGTGRYVRVGAVV